jgi:hypothetical protein
MSELENATAVEWRAYIMRGSFDPAVVNVNLLHGKLAHIYNQDPLDSLRYERVL